MAKTEYTKIKWTDLLPKDWKPAQVLKSLNFDDMDDNDPRIEKALEQYKKLWEEAPANTSMEGQKIKIPGYVVALDFESRNIKEFLLVPYFGACVHMPPPPSNQTLFVRAKKALKNIYTMDTVWVSGTLKIQHMSSDVGAASYELSADKIEVYNDE
jgi:hypothetical protein